MSPHRTFRIALCLLVVVSLVGAVAPGAAAPPPRPLCDACGDSFEETAASHGVALTVERSTATVTVRENGSATWVVRNHLAGDGAATLRTNASLRADIAGRAMWDAEFRGANVSANGVLTMRYREAEFAERSVGGAFRSGAFTEAHGYRNLDGLGADRLVLVAPPGTRVGWTAGDATVSDDGRRMTLTQFEEGSFVTFVPRDAWFGPVLSALAVGSTVGPALALNALAYVALPAAVFALIVGAVAGALSRFDRDVERVRSSIGVGLGVAGALVTTLSLAASGGVSLLGGAAAPLFGVGIGLVVVGAVFSRPEIQERVTYRVLVAGAAVGALVAAGATVAGAVAFDQNGLTRSLISGLPFLVPAFALLPAGYALGRSNRRLAVGTAAVGFALALMPVTPITSPVVEFGSLFVLFATASAAVVAVVGAPLLVAGASLAAPSTVRSET